MINGGASPMLQVKTRLNSKYAPAALMPVPSVGSSAKRERRPSALGRGW